MPLALPSKWAAASDLWDNVEVPPTAAFVKINDAQGTLTGDPYAHVVLRLKGVRDGGPAYRVGLEGETFSRHPVSPQARQPITITIRDGSGEHQVTYFPQGAAHGVPQYVPIMPAARFNECFRAGKLDP